MRKGFTLIELLIVVTIIAILAGAAIPYVQEYIEDARISRVKADLNEIKNALIRYELDKGTTWPANETTIAKLVGPYLAKSLQDPWGSPYVINESSSVVFSAGPDRNSAINGAGSEDNIAVEFRPPMAQVKAFWIDVNNDSLVNTPDEFLLRYTRPVSASAILAASHFFISINGATPAALNAATVKSITGKQILLVGSPSAVGVTPGRDYMLTTTNSSILSDFATSPYGPRGCGNNEVTIQALK